MQASPMAMWMLVASGQTGSYVCELPKWTASDRNRTPERITMVGARGRRESIVTSDRPDWGGGTVSIDGHEDARAGRPPTVACTEHRAAPHLGDIWSDLFYIYHIRLPYCTDPWLARHHRWLVRSDARSRDNKHPYRDGPTGTATADGTWDRTGPAI